MKFINHTAWRLLLQGLPDSEKLELVGAQKGEAVAFDEALLSPELLEKVRKVSRFSTSQLTGY